MRSSNPPPELQEWRVFLDRKLTDKILETGYLCLEIPESFKLTRIMPENGSNHQYSVMYTPCDIRELALYSDEEQDRYVSSFLRLVFERLLTLVGINDTFFRSIDSRTPRQHSKECKRAKIDHQDDGIEDQPSMSVSKSCKKSRAESKERSEWFLCRTVSVNSHSLPLSTPINWISCDDIEHILHTIRDDFHFHDMFYICLPLRLKHSCIHEDKERTAINVNAQKEMIILLTEKFSEFSNHVKKSVYFNSLVGDRLESRDVAVEADHTKPDQVKLIESKGWNRYFPTNSLRVGIFMTLKISTINLFKINPGLFQTPLFINPFYNSTSCPSCYFSWLRLINTGQASGFDSFDSVEKALSDEEMHVLALETKVRIFLNGCSPNDEYIRVRKIAPRSTVTDGETNENVPITYAGEAIWPGITSKGALNPKVLVGPIHSNYMVLGAKPIGGVHSGGDQDYSSDSENDSGDGSGNGSIPDNHPNTEVRDPTSEGVEQWTQGGEIVFKSRHRDLELCEKNLEDFVFEQIHDEDPNCCGSNRSREHFQNDMTIGNTRLVKVCSKYTLVPYFGSRNIVKINDSHVYGSSALGISAEKKSQGKNISISLLSYICSYLPLQDFLSFRQVCRTHCCRTIFNSYVQNLTLFESDLYLPILGQLYPLLSKAKSITVVQVSDDEKLRLEMLNSEVNDLTNPDTHFCRIPPIAIQCLAAYTPKVKKMIFYSHSNANLAKITSRASGRKPDTIVIAPELSDYGSSGLNFNLDEGNENEVDEQMAQEIIASLGGPGQESGFLANPNMAGMGVGGSSDLSNPNGSHFSNGIQLSSSNLSSNPAQDSQETELSTADQSSLLNLQSFPESMTSISPSLIEIHIIGSIESSNSLPTSLFRIPITAPFRKLIRYFRDVASIQEGIIDLYILRYGIKDRLIPDLSPVDYGILKGPTVLFAIGYKTLQYSQKIWISLFLVGSPNFPYLPKLRFNASMSTPFSRLAESYSRNVNISVNDVMFIYKDSEIDLNLSPYDYNVSENDTIEVVLRTRSNNDSICNAIMNATSIGNRINIS
ncbi:ubiquitin domain at the C-terminus [Cryptosporidium canis]|uniref:Ubiquitin domain at the C-terminus n=1 Tax=Cryptosporidium canis TaxID=195482 RepID=A0ABQ8PBD9_9CRYT|nr:ubiquitin domain at the C-terminus [Cryptosporidium canis]